MKVELINKIFCILLYVTSSLTATMSNKYLINVLNYKHHFLLIGIQSAIIVMVLFVYAIAFKKEFKTNLIYKWAVASIFLTAMIISNMKSLFYFEISLFTLYKNCSIIIVALIEYVIFSNKITLISIISFILIILSSLTAEIVTTHPPIGYIWMGFNIFSSAFFVLYLRKLMMGSGSRTECVFYTNLFSIPCILIVSYFFDDYTNNVEIDIHIVSWILISSVAALLTAFSTTWVLKILSSTAYTIFGAFNKFLLTGLSFIFFNESMDLIKIISTIVGVFSGLLYSIEAINIKERI